ncbi:MAG: glycosyltransferase family 4 protein [Bacteroidota bacterium]
MAQRILIISPTPTHPTNAGNRSRILVYLKYLIGLGHQVHFLYSDQEESDIKAMEDFWGERFHYVPYKAPVKVPFNRFMMRLSPGYRYYSHVDDHYNELLDEKIRELHREFSFTAVIVEYIFNTRAFLNFGSEVLRVVDTHDVMTDRHKHFLRAGKPAVWYSTPRREEKKGIDRADIVMAIQDREASFYRKLTRKKVITVGHSVTVTAPPIKVRPFEKILFVGSSNPSNFHAISDFITGFLPVLREKHRGLQLLLAGRICQVIEETEGVISLGEVADLADAYNTSDIVCNPLTIGTGLKIKMIEALGYGKAVISTTVGAEGLEAGAGSAFLLADTPGQFNYQLDRLLEEPGCFSSVVEHAVRFANGYNHQVYAELSSLFSD